MEKILGLLQTIPVFFDALRRAESKIRTGSKTISPMHRIIYQTSNYRSTLNGLSREERQFLEQGKKSKITQKVQGALFASLHLEPFLEKGVERQEVTFRSVVRHLPGWKFYVQDASRLKSLHRLCRNLQEANWEKIVSSYYSQLQIDWLAKDALQAFYKGRISYRQFSTLTFCWALFKQFPDAKIHLQPLFDQGGNFHQVALKAVKDGLLMQNRAQESIIGQEEIETLCRDFFENMRLYEPSEQFFFYIDFSEREGQNRPLLDMRHCLKERAGFGVFDLFMLEESCFQMIPSFSMIQALVDAYGGENSIAVCPTIGLSTEEDLCSNARKRGRDFFLPFIGIAFPQIADGILTPDLFQFLRHDLYHCLTVSQIPDGYRKEAARVFTLLCLIQERFQAVLTPMEQAFLKIVIGQVIDMDFPSFRPFLRQQRALLQQEGESPTDSELFLMELQRIIFLSGVQLIQEMEIEGIQGKERADLTLHFASLCSETILFKQWGKAMYLDGFFERFKIDISSGRLSKLIRGIESCMKIYPFPFDKNMHLIVHLYTHYSPNSRFEL